MDRAVEKVEDVGNIIGEFRGLKQRIETAQERFDGLSVKLGDALKPSRPREKNPEEMKEDTDLAPLAIEIRALKYAVERLTADITDVADRLDL